jgi:hypothetical protein
MVVARVIWIAARAMGDGFRFEAEASQFETDPIVGLNKLSLQEG